MTTQTDNQRSARFTSRLAIGLVLVSILGAAAGCAGATGAALADREFLSVKVTDAGADRPLVAGTRISLSFRATDLSASAGCNTMGGGYRIEGGELVFERGAMTAMGCDVARGAQDDWLLKLLGSHPVVRLNANDLVLESGSIAVHLLDRKVVEPDLNIVGPTWTVVSLVSGDAVSSIPDGATATLIFKADGSLTIFSGCNQGGATWKTAGSGIEVSGIVLTKKACAGAAAQLESSVLEVLRAGSIAVKIDANLMTLRAGARGLQLRAG